MSFKIHSDKLVNQLGRIRRDQADSMERLASGEVFTSNDPRPAERAISDGLEHRVRSLAASKRNVNDAVSLLQVADGAMTEINNMVTRMKEINIAASNTTVTDRDRSYLFVEYEALYNEITRVANTTEFNGIPLLNGESEGAPEALVFRLDAPFNGDVEGVSDDDDINVIRFDNLKDIVITASGLGLASAADLLLDSDDEGVSIDDVVDLMIPEDGDFSTVYDQALTTLASQRAIFGSMQSRLSQGLNYIDVMQENFSAAKSKIADTDYASETARLTELNILTQASTGLLAQSNFDANLSLNLLTNLGR